MDRLTKYLGTMFGTAMFLEEYHSYDSLPMYLADQYQLLRLQVGADAYILAKPRDTIKINITTLKKQCAQIKKHTGLMPVLVLENLRLAQRNALIQAGIAFLVPEKQMYIPQFLMNLTEVETSIEAYGEEFSVAAQVVFIYLLLNEITETNAHQLSERLSYSVATINRALKELSHRKLLHTKGNGTRKLYTIPDCRVYWDNGKKFLFDPVKSRQYVTLEFPHFDFQMSNDLALSRLSFLNGRNINYYAGSAQAVKTIDKQYLLNEYDVFDHNYCIVEVFRYDPRLLSVSQYIDVISLYAQFKDHRDERVQIEIESLVRTLRSPQGR